MKVKDIYTDSKTKIFVVTNQDDENILNWSIDPTKFKLLPEEENIYFVKALEVSPNNLVNCYLGIMIPEMIAESAILMTSEGETIAKDIYDMEHKIIPIVASDCPGSYELYYAKENPQIGIDILRSGLDKAANKNIVAEDLGYILRDEGRVEEAIEAFKISEDNDPSSEYTYLELSRLFKELGRKAEQMKYEQKFKFNG